MRSAGPAVPLRMSGVLSHAWPAIIIYGVFTVMLVVLALVSPAFPSVSSVTNLLSSALPLAFAAMAQTIVILVRGIDLSVGPAMSLVGVVAASLMRDSPASIAATILLCLALGLVIGAANGALVVLARLQPVIVTLATSSILAGAALFIMPQPGGYVPPVVGSFVTGAVGFVPVPLIILVASLLLFWLPLRRSRIGLAWYAVGGNEAGAFASGINTRLVRFTAFLLGGFFSSLAGLTLASQTLTGDPMIGDPYTLSSIAAAVLGGTNLAGGRGGAIGSLGGVFVLTIVVDILFFFRVSAYYQYVLSGAIVIVALAIVALSEYLRSRRATRGG